MGCVLLGSNGLEDKDGRQDHLECSTFLLDKDHSHQETHLLVSCVLCLWDKQLAQQFLGDSNVLQDRACYQEQHLVNLCDRRIPHYTSLFPSPTDSSVQCDKVHIVTHFLDFRCCCKYHQDTE